MTQTENTGGGKYTDEVRAHEFDGIQEFDNHLPNWWLWTFYGACIFALFYWLFYHGFAWGDSPRVAFRKEMEAAAASRVVANVTDESLIALSQDPAAVAAGKEVFATVCFACHGPEGNGMLGGAPGIGPNLTDNAWIHGGAPTQIYNTISNGVVEKGMQAWGPVYGPTKVQQLAAFVLSIRNTNVAGGKPPQGEPYQGN